MLDTQLMEQFVATRDSRAFRDLIDRHGPAVLRICRRLIQDPHEAEDAMQATFLILVQRAPSLRDPEQVNRWLAGVARRVAARARRRMVRRVERERSWAIQQAETRTDGEVSGELELRYLVREELGRMPEADRRPLTLCYLDGLTHEEAAHRIGCPVGTIKARLVRARRRLRDRLDRRGIALSLGLLLLLLRCTSSASAQDTLWDRTADLMDWEAQGDREAVTAGAPGAAALVRGGTRTVGLPPRLWLIGVAVGLLAVVGAVGIGTVWVQVNRDRAQQITARLLSVLNVDCRAGP